jgi:hypothetical protein
LQTYIIDPKPGIDLLEVAVGYFTSTTFPSVIVGFATDEGGTGGLYLYTSTTNTLAGPWQRSVISPGGYYYEHAQPFLYPGDTYPGVIASHDGQVTWYTNPANQGHDPTTYPWGQITVASGYWCHDLGVADLYPAFGLPDVACAASSVRDTPSFIAIESNYNDWQTAQPYSIGDGIGLVSVNGGPRINVAGATSSGLNWYLNPAVGGGDPLTGAWNQYSVDGGNPAANINTTAIGVVPDYSGNDDAIVIASSENTWTPGLEWWGPNADPTQPWNVHAVDSTYRAVHEINGGVYDGVPYFIVGEQEQAGGTAQLAATHPGIPSRVEMFAYNGSTFVPALTLSTQGTHNQVTIPFQSSLLTVGANHQLYGGYPPLQAWLITAGGSSAATPTPTPIPTPTAALTPAPSSSITFIGRTEDSANSASTTVNASPPAGVQNGDFMLLCVASWNSVPAAPSGFTRLGTAVKNSNLDYLSAFYKFYAAGDGLPYVVGASSWPDAVLRAYRGVSAVDASAFAGSSSAATNLTLPALPATNASGDEYVGCIANDTQPITLPSDLGHTTTQASQWQLGDGDKALGGAGTVPPAETATSSEAANWIGLAATLKAGALPSPTPTSSSTPTPTQSSTPTPTGTPSPTPTRAATPTPTAAATPTPVSGIQFDGRTQNSVNASGTSVTAITPSGVRNGDYLVATVDSWNSTLPAPANWSILTATNNTVANSQGDHIALIYRVWHTGDPTLYSLGAGSLAYPKVVLRAYNGVSGIDAFACGPQQGKSSKGPSFSLPALPATKAVDEFAGYWASDTGSITGPSDLSDGTSNTVQWASFDGDKSISAGTVPPTDTAFNSGSANWIGCDITLEQ